MTYENALNWAIENIPMQEFDSFDDWYGTVQENLLGVTDSEQFQSMAFTAWQDAGFEEQFRDTSQVQVDEFISPQNTVDARIDINTGQVESIRPIGQQTPIPVQALPPVEPERQLPPTGRAPEIKSNVIVKQSFLERVKRLFRF